MSKSILLESIYEFQSIILEAREERESKRSGFKTAGMVGAGALGAGAAYRYGGHAIASGLGKRAVANSKRGATTSMEYGKHKSFQLSKKRPVTHRTAEGQASLERGKGLMKTSKSHGMGSLGGDLRKAGKFFRR
jgi:hypothetical protein